MLKRSGSLTFPGSPTDEREVCAILVTADDSGNIHHFVRTGHGMEPPPDDICALLAQSAALANLTHLEE